MTDQYKTNFEKGLLYQDYLVKMLAPMGIIIMPFSSKFSQFTTGESFSRHEIKFDDRMSSTGNIYIEVGEKTSSSLENYTPSGILRDDNTLFFLIGNYQTLFFFSKKILKLLVMGSKKSQWAYVETPTSQGYLLPITEAAKYADVIEFENKN